jgi:long-chain acyl-CoA synthetase
VSEIVQRFSRIALEQPERPLIYVSGTNEVLTASEVWRVYVEVRQRLATIGIGRDQLVVTAAGNRPAAIPLLLACLALRAPLMPIDAGAAMTEIAEIATRFGASAVVLPKSVVTNYGRQSLLLVDDLALVYHRVDGPPYGDAALLKLTSGSTGFPKAALTTESELISDTDHITEAMGIRPADIQIAAIPLSHAYGFSNLVMPLLLQGTAVALRESFVPQQLLIDARKCQARVFPGVPYMFNYFVANPPVDGWPSCLEQVTSAGARLDVQTTEAFDRQFGRKIHSFYGTSEAGGITYDAGDAANDDGHVGTPLPGVSVTVRADEDAPAGSGRVFVESAAVASGYLHGRDDLEVSFDQENLFVDGGFLTGDFGFFDNRRYLNLTGRASGAVNVAGRKVQPAEIERVLRSMEGVEDAHVIAAPDARRGQQIVACVISRRNLTALDVRQFCAARLAAYKLPRAIIFLPSLPTTARGKTDHATLLALVLEQLEKRV